MTTLVSIDGKPCEPQQATVSVFDRGFLYGDSVFETVRTYDGQPYALVEHLERLKQSADRVFIDLPLGLEQLAAEVRALVEQAGNPESYIRVMITRGNSLTMGLPPDLSSGPRRVIIITPLSPPSAELYASGIKVVTYRTRRATDDTGAEGAKVANYLVAVMAMKQARAADAHEALIVDGQGHIVEGATSNVFFVSSGKLVTPPLSAGILPGITRAGVLKVADEVGIGVELRAPRLEDLLAAEEVFISSSVRELLAVTHVDGKPIAGAVPGPTYQRLLEGFRAHVRVG